MTLDGDRLRSSEDLSHNNQVRPSPAVSPKFTTLQIYCGLGINPPPLCQAAEGLLEIPLSTLPEVRVDPDIERHLWGQHPDPQGVWNSLQYPPVAPSILRLPQPIAPPSQPIELICR